MLGMLGGKNMISNNYFDTMPERHRRMDRRADIISISISRVTIKLVDESNGGTVSAAS